VDQTSILVASLTLRARNVGDLAAIVIQNLCCLKMSNPSKVARLLLADSSEVRTVAREQKQLLQKRLRDFIR
jgi:hypothetical protein